MRAFLIRFASDASGATAIEYTIIAAGVAVAIVGAISALSGAVSGKFDSVKSAVQ